MVGLVALDFILGIVLRGMVGMSLVIEVFGVDRDDSAGHATGLGIPACMIANFESLRHLLDSFCFAVPGRSAPFTSRKKDVPRIPITQLSLLGARLKKSSHKYRKTMSAAFLDNAAAVSTRSSDPTDAAAFVKFATSPAARPLWRKDVDLHGGRSGVRRVGKR
jgi:hypothetical protein